MDIKEKIADKLAEALARNSQFDDIPFVDIAQAILDLTYDCSACNGSGKLDVSPLKQSEKFFCSVCHGTGRGSKMLGVIDTDQSLPIRRNNERLDSDYNYKYYAFGDICRDAQQDMISQGWKRIKED